MSSVNDRIARLVEWLEKGHITKAEFEQQKKALLSGDSAHRTLTEQPLTSQHPKNIGFYNVSSILGAGGMGTVYRGRHRSETFAKKNHGGDVAIKVLHAQFASRSEVVERLEREAELGARLDHPGIVKVFDLVMDRQRVAVIMELVEGQPLSQVSKNQDSRIPWAQILEWLEPLIEAVGYAHEHGVVHRDLKPDNILLTEDGKVKVLDFGIAKDQNSGQTRTGMGMGTPSYMAPEQFTSAKDADLRADLYALGMTVYELLTGRQPWEPGTTDFTVMELKKNGQLFPPSSFLSDLPEHVEAALEFVLSPALEDRPESAAQLYSWLLGETPVPERTSQHAATWKDADGVPSTNTSATVLVEDEALSSPAEESPTSFEFSDEEQGGQDSKAIQAKDSDLDTRGSPADLMSPPMPAASPLTALEEYTPLPRAPQTRAQMLQLTMTLSVILIGLVGSIWGLSVLLGGDEGEASVEESPPPVTTAPRLERAWASMAIEKTDTDENENAELLMEALIDARAATAELDSAEAWGAYALAQLWKTRLHTLTDQAKAAVTPELDSTLWTETDAIIAQAIEHGSDEATLARAMFRATSCIDLLGSHQLFHAELCEGARADFRAVEEAMAQHPRSWLRGESLWTHAAFLNRMGRVYWIEQRDFDPEIRRIQGLEDELDYREAAGNIWSELSNQCQQVNWTLALQEAPVDGIFLAQYCTQAHGWLGFGLNREDEVIRYTERARMLRSLDAGNGDSVQRSTARVVYQSAHPDCIDLKTTQSYVNRKRYPDQSHVPKLTVFDADNLFTTQTLAEHRCYATGLAVFECRDEIVGLQKDIARKLPGVRSKGMVYLADEKPPDAPSNWAAVIKEQTAYADFAARIPEDSEAHCYLYGLNPPSRTAD